MNDTIYTIGQVCKELGVKQHYLRNLEKSLDLDIARDTLGNRSYTEYDLKKLIEIKSLKDQGLTHKAIKEKIPTLTKNEIIIDTSNKIINQLPAEIIENMKILIDELVITRVDGLLEEKKNTLLSELIDIKEAQSQILQNSNKMKIEIEKQQELHYKEIDNKLINLKNTLELRQNKKKKQSLLKRLFKRND